jgi:hypothetical protein
MMETPAALWRRALSPVQGFRERRAQAPGLGPGLKEMLAYRTPVAFVAILLESAGFALAYGRIRRTEGPLWDALWSRLGDQVDPAQIKALLAGLPDLPSWPWVAAGAALAAPIWVLSLWLHDAVWDHGSLWLLRGLQGPRTLKVSLAAEAEALKVGTVGAALDLFASLPIAGCFFSTLLLPVRIYFWMMRGMALAAWHGCPLWKGICATLLHALLAGLLAFGSLGLFLLLVVRELRLA